MGKSLNIEKIEADASAILGVATKTKELQALVNKAYPGYIVTITKDDAAPAETQLTLSNDTFSQLSGIAQIETVLRDNAKPMAIANIFESIKARGGTMSKNTMMSILSTHRKTKFSKAERGFWTVPT